MLDDRYGQAISTASGEVRDAYVTAVDVLLSANAGAVEAFERVIALEPSLALAHAGRGRALQVLGRAAEARVALATAQQAAVGASARERSQIAIFHDLVNGRGGAALEGALKHLDEHPRDAMALAPLTGVFGLIGFSGQRGRERRLRELLDRLAPAYGDDWWFTAARAFALAEDGAVADAVPLVERSIAINPRNANGAHIRSHVHYESGEAQAGLAYLDRWLADYDRMGPLHCHLYWHVALWALELGREAEAWRVVEQNIAPGASWGPPLNTLTDMSSFLFRAELAGAARRPEAWTRVARYATECFPIPGLVFADVHAAMAFGMAGDAAGVTRIVEGSAGPAAEVVRELAAGFSAFAGARWDEAAAHLGATLARHEQIGGSRAQRDLIEDALVMALTKAGRSDEAERIETGRRLRGHRH